MHLNIYFSSLLLPCVQEDQLHVKGRPEHEHVAVEFHLRDGAAGQGVTHGYQPNVLEAAIEWSHVHGKLLDLQVAATVDDLGGGGRSRQP